MAVKKDSTVIHLFIGHIATGNYGVMIINHRIGVVLVKTDPFFHKS